MHIRLLGGFAVELDGAPVDARRWRLRKAKLLVATLALAPDHRQHREQVLDRFWPDLDPAAAARNLHQTLYISRQALGERTDTNGLLLIRDDQVILSADKPITVDVAEFEEAAELALQTRVEQQLRAAVDRYGGELLPEFPYVDWLTARRTELREAYDAVLLRLADVLSEREPEQAATLLQDVLESNPVNESAVRAHMALQARSGRRSAALARYEHLQDDLLDAYGTDPDPQTRALFQELLTGGLLPTAEEQLRRQGNIALSLTSFIGRDRELADIESLLARVRLLTLTGPGGCGKTRLALEVGRQRQPSYADGVWFIDLSALTEPRLLPDVIIAALGLDAAARKASTSALIDQLRSQRTLLILDNCEHLLASCAHLVSAVLAACPAVKVLATSREPMRAPGEVMFRVPSLQVPAAGVADSDIQRLEDIGSVHLFIERARAVRPDFALTADNRQAVADLCRRLDGIPLAIELAAARVSLLEPQEIVTRLDDALSVLGQGPTGVTRHQTLRAALEWSHQLLTVDEQVLLRRLSVFAGSFDLAAVEAVCCAQPLDGANLLDLLGRLVDKSLVQAEQAAGESWYRQLDTVRQFARERLGAAGELSAIAAAHCTHYLAQAVAQDPDLGRGVVAETPRVLERHHDNLRAALQWSCSADPDSAIRLAASLWRFWFLRGYAAEGVDWVQRALAATAANTPERARALLGLAGLDSRLGRNDRHRELATEAVTVLESIGATHEAALTRLVQGALVWATSDLEDAVRIAEDVRARATQLDRPDLVAGTTWLRAMCELSREDATAAAPLLTQCLEELSRIDAESTPFLPVVSPCVVLVPFGGRLQPYFEETLVIGRRVGSVQGIGYVRAAQGYVARLDGNLPAARDVVAAAVGVFAEISDDMGRATALNQLGCILRDDGDYDGAEHCLGEAVELRRRVGDRRGELLTMVNHALLDAVRGKVVDGRRTALRCLTAFEAIDEQPGIGASLSALAAIELISGELRAARALYSRAAHALAPWPRLEAWFRLAGCEITVELGEFDRVEADLARAATVLRRLGSVVGLDLLNSLQAKLPSR